jgi:hypothetical protein
VSKSDSDTMFVIIFGAAAGFLAAMQFGSWSESICAFIVAGYLALRIGTTLVITEIKLASLWPQDEIKVEVSMRKPVEVSVDKWPLK